MAIACLGLLMSSGPASAQKTYSFSVSRHASVSMSERQVDDILAKASQMLQKRAACNVAFKRVGLVSTFTSPNEAGKIRTQRDRDAVHKDKRKKNVINVKIVNEIDFCRPTPGVDSFDGCSWPHAFRSIIVRGDLDHPQLVWAHEFGHQTGLWHHRGNVGKMLMSPCSLEDDNAQLTPDECACLLSGPGTCNTKEPKPRVVCPQ
jgi:hypothetical protein